MSPRDRCRLDFPHFSVDYLSRQGYNGGMNYEISVGALFFGLLIVIAGALFLRFHQWIADNFGGGVGSYERYKLYALITCGVGLLVALNLHSLILTWFLSPFFNR